MSIYLPEQMEDVISRIKRKVVSQQIKLGPILTEQTVCNFEQTYMMKLPEAYRRFLLEVGDGCMWHSGYQLLSLNRMDNLKQEKLSLSFPFDDEWIWETEDNPSQSKMEEVENGNIELIDVGCGQSFHLIITGKCCGEVWHFCEMGIQPCCQRQDFLGWFEKWIDCGDGVNYFEEYPY